jgi:hypothetical protein
MDPDIVVFDALGHVSGDIGAVLVLGVASGEAGQITAVFPDESVRRIFGPSGAYYNVSQAVLSDEGVLFLADRGPSSLTTGRVLRTAGEEPRVIASLSPSPIGIASRADRRLFIVQSNGVLSVFDDEGGVIVPGLSDGLSRFTLLAFSKGDAAFGQDLYAVGDDAILWRIAPDDGSKHRVGRVGTATTDISFGPDGAMYLSDLRGDLVWRVTGCGPNCDGNESLNINDFICMQAEWRARSAYGDYNGDGRWNINDFIAFQAEFRRGCP